jgi:hypothetical protein
LALCDTKGGEPVVGKTAFLQRGAECLCQKQALA